MTGEACKPEDMRVGRIVYDGEGWPHRIERLDHVDAQGRQWWSVRDVERGDKQLVEHDMVMLGSQS